MRTRSSIGQGAVALEVQHRIHQVLEDLGTRDRPFLTLERARDAVRALKAQETGWPAGGVTVHLAGGTYPRQATFALGSEDSGRPGAPITSAISRWV